jgi:hypothetical protein
MPSEDLELGHALRPGSHAFEGNLRRVPTTSIHVDDDGCRVARVSGSRERGALVLGDSFTHGDGVEAKDRWTDRVNRRLPDNALHLRNCAVPGYNWSQIARAAELHAPSAALVVGVFSNDLRGASDLASMLPADGFLGALERHSRLARLLRLVVRLQQGALEKDHLSTEELESALERLEATLAADAPRVAVILEPPHHPTVDFPSLLEDRGWRVLSAPDLSAPGLRIPGDGHLNVHGHRRVAEWLHPLLGTALTPGVAP